jgi:hypothetical protein
MLVEDISAERRVEIAVPAASSLAEIERWVAWRYAYPLISLRELHPTAQSSMCSAQKNTKISLIRHARGHSEAYSDAMRATCELDAAALIEAEQALQRGHSDIRKATLLLTSTLDTFYGAESHTRPVGHF